MIGRVFWRGALDRLAPELDTARVLDSLLGRELIAPEERSSISGDRAFQFRHILIRDVAYGGLTKAERAEGHKRFADWVAERAPDDLVEIRAHHLDRACALLAELEGSVPRELAHEAAAVLEETGVRTLRGDSFESARRLFRRANELEPALERRYLAAHAALELGDLGAVAAEMTRVREEAAAAGDAGLEGRALVALATVALSRDGDPLLAEELASAALETLPPDDATARIDALSRLTTAAWWPGDLRRAETYTRQALEVAERADRRDLRTNTMLVLAWLLELRLDLDGAEQALEALEPVGEGVLDRARARQAVGSLRRIQGRLDEAADALAEARELFLEAGASGQAAGNGVMLGWIAFCEGDLARAQREFRDATRTFAKNEDRSHLCEAQRGLAEALLELGQTQEAERLALSARALVGRDDLTSQSSTTMTLGLVRAAQGRDEEAEALLRESLSMLEPTDFRLISAGHVGALARFLRSRGRDAEAAEVEAQVPAAVHGWLDASRLDATVAAPA
jgi:ATP/maltotriose-dependent transcriptional regulator MalT